MGLEALTQEETEIVRRCLRAIVEGPFHSDGDFHAIVGLSRGEATDVLAQWPSLDEGLENVTLALNNSMNGLLIWWGWQDENPEAGEALLKEWVGASAEEIERIFCKWRGDR